MARHGNAFIVSLVLLFLAPSTIANPAASTPRLLEGELTALLRRVLAPLDPAEFTQTSFDIAETVFDVTVAAENVSCSNFSIVDVTTFDPPLPFLSDQVKIVTKTDIVHIAAKSYSMVGTINQQLLNASGALWIDVDDLVFDLSFESDSFSTDPELELCVKSNTFRAKLYANSFTGEFDGLPQINDKINAFGSFLLFEVEKFIKAHQQEVEDGLNDIFCGKKQNPPNPLQTQKPQLPTCH